MDVTNYERIEEVKKEINTDLGLVDILINNAGLVPKISLRDGKPSDIQRLIDVNVMAHFWVITIFVHFEVHQILLNWSIFDFNESNRMH